MQIGSLVVCIKKVEWDDPNMMRSIELEFLNRYGKKIKFNIKCPVVEKTYMVRAIDEGNAILLEEIVNEKLPLTDSEPWFNIECFREVLPPMNILKKIEEDNLIEIEAWK